MKVTFASRLYYLLICIVIVTALFLVIHFKISNVLEESKTVTKFIFNKRRKFSTGTTQGHKESETDVTDGILHHKSSITTSSESLSQPSHDFIDNKPTSSLSQSSSSSLSQSTTTTIFPSHPQHRILSLNDEAFLSTPLNEMMSWYGEAEGGGSCQDDFGNKLINRWRDEKKTYCHSNYDTAASISTSSNSKRNVDNKTLKSSSIDCYLVHQTRHAGNGDNLCVYHNVSVQLGLFTDDSKTRPVVNKYVETRHMIQPYIPFEKGFIQGYCDPVKELWQDKYMPGWNKDLTTTAFQPLSSSSSSKTVYNSNGNLRINGIQKIGIDNNNDNSNNQESSYTTSSTTSSSLCDEWIEHPVLLVQRDTFANFFHDSEDFFNVFIAFSVLKWNLKSSQIFLTDLYPKGPFWDIWSKPFSSGVYPVLDAWDLRYRRYSTTATSSATISNNNSQSRVCFRQLAIGIYGPASPVTVASWDTPCSATALVKAYSDFIIRGLKLQAFTHYALPVPSRTITITYLARRSSTVWPEKKYCQDEHSFFLCKLWANWGIRSLSRVIKNDAELVRQLKLLETRSYHFKQSQSSNNNHNKGDNNNHEPIKVKFQDVDYNILSFEDQIKVDLQTDILIGPHGAGLMHNIFMRDRAILMELSIDGSGIQRHFHNLARWYGRKYMGVSCTNPIDIEKLVVQIVRAIESIDVDSY